MAITLNNQCPPTTHISNIKLSCQPRGSTSDTTRSLRNQLLPRNQIHSRQPSILPLLRNLPPTLLNLTRNIPPTIPLRRLPIQQIHARPQCPRLHQRRQRIPHPDPTGPLGIPLDDRHRVQRQVDQIRLLDLCENPTGEEIPGPESCRHDPFVDPVGDGLAGDVHGRVPDMVAHDGGIFGGLRAHHGGPAVCVWSWVGVQSDV
jgi:hypothetical protein